MVSLISITKPEDDLSVEEFIAYVARVSNPGNQYNKETSAKLLKYLIKHKHWSPFELVHLTIEINTSRGIAAQILRHRSFSFQEFSQRYQKVDDYVIYQARRQDLKNRQNSIDDMTQDDKEWFCSAQQKVWELSNSLYSECLEKGIAKEQARFLLPLNTSSKLYMSGSLRSWLHYVDLRASHETQLEHRQIALEVKAILKKHFPFTSEAMWGDL